MSSILSTEVERDQIWIHLAKQRLPKITLDSREQFRNREESQVLPTFEEFRRFLEVKAKGRREFENDDSHVSNSRKDSHEHRSNRYRSYDSSNRSRGANQNSFSRGNNGLNRRDDSHTASNDDCVLCGKFHLLYQCEKYKSLRYNDRLSVVNQYRLCKCCLRRGHYARNCSFNGCRRCPDVAIRHNLSLCPKQVENYKPKSEPTDDDAELNGRPPDK